MNIQSQKHSLVLLITDLQVQLLRWRSRELSLLRVYDKTPEDVEKFTEDLRPFSGLSVLVVVDLIEESFRYDTIVHVSGSDQRAVLKRKMDFAFRNTQYRRSKVIERETEGRRDDKILLSAISRPELVEVWVNALLEQKFAIQSVTSLAYILETFLSLAKVTEGNFYLITNLENGNNLRQTFFRNGRMLFSRQTTLTTGGRIQAGDDIYRETGQVRQYLERSQFIAYDATLRIAVYTPYDESLLHLEARSNDLNRFEVANTGTLPSGTENIWLSPTHYFLSEVLARSRPANIYAPAATTRFHDIKTIGYRTAATAGLMLVLAIAASIPMAFSVNEQWREIEQLKSQVAPLQAQYEALSESLPPIPASSDEMELVVDTHEKLARQVSSPVSTMNTISSALAQSSGLLLMSIDWSVVEAPAAALTEPGSLSAPPATTLIGLTESNSKLGFLLDDRSQIKILIEGQAYSSSSFTEAQNKVADFIDALADSPGLNVYASRLPTDVRTDISVSTTVTDGEIRAPFALELTLPSRP